MKLVPATRNRAIAFAIIVALMSALLLPSQALAVGTRISTIWSTAPDIWGNRIVWSQHTDSPTFDKYPAIWVYNLSTRQKFPITDGAREAVNPAIWGTKVAWGESSLAMGVASVFVHDLATGTDYYPSGLYMAEKPDLAGKWVVWSGWNPFGTIVSHIYLTDTSNGQLYNVTNDQSPQDDPHISSNWVVLSDTRTTDADIYALDLSAWGWRQFTTSGGYEIEPAVSGNYVVWSDNRSGNWDIWLGNLVTGEQRALDTNSNHQYGSAISGNTVVWTDQRDGNENIYVHDLLTGLTRRLTSEAAHQRYPEISGYGVVWEDYRYDSQQANVFYTALSRPSLSMSAPARVRYRRTARLTGKLLSVAGLPFRNASVKLQKSYNGRSWTSLRTVTTGSTGAYACYTPRLTRLTYFRARYQGKLSLMSPRRLVRVVR